MKNVSQRLIFTMFCFSFLGLSSCKDFIEPSLNKRVIRPRSPASNYQSPKYTLNFWWDEVEDAGFYQLQVVTPDFDAPGSLILDTVIAKNSFSINLDPGDYQWRVRGLNGSSQTEFSAPITFGVLQSSIKQQAVQLVSPANNTVTNISAATFIWGSLFGATKYHFQLDTNNFVNEGAILYDVSLPGQQIVYTFSKDQTFQWRVRAENDTAQARWSQVNQVVYDHTPPETVTLSAPLSGSTVSRPVTMQWTAVKGAVKYKVYALKSDSASNYDENFPLTLTNTLSYSFKSGTANEKVYWQVAAIDAAGNEGLKSLVRHFIIQQ
ncbi:hypothetical protein ABIB62_004242 [Mucilaginibacter sp. UYP25]|uniref:hypothetical protein n=2 Tax=unclassified Mucilaginibacter TaxID=2617802 RepID=UPI00339B430A